MLRLMLDAHSRIVIPFETNFISEDCLDTDQHGDLNDDDSVLSLVSQIQDKRFVKRGELGDLDPRHVLQRVQERTYGGVVYALFQTLAEQCGKSRWGDKSPNMVLKIDVIHRLFPEAVILHLIRDGRDVVMSRMGAWGSRPSVINFAHEWAWNVSVGRRLGAMLPDNYREVRYEDLVLQPAETLEQICQWIGESYEPGMLEYHHGAAGRMPAESMQFHANSVETPNPQKVFGWRTSMRLGHRAVVQAVARDLLNDLQYDLEEERLSFRMARRMTEIQHALLGLAVHRSPRI